MAKKIGIIGNTGRMGSLLQAKIASHDFFTLGPGVNRSQTSNTRMEEVFKQSDYVIDFSKGKAIIRVLEAVINIPKPLVICSTGWSREEVDNLIQLAAKKVPLVIVSNTSIGAYIQGNLAKQVAKVLGPEYDIDIIEKHHRNKVDAPSATAKNLINDIKQVKQQVHNMNYQTEHKIIPRPNNYIGVNVERTGNIHGEHEITFTSENETLSIKHVVFDRKLFAVGALRIVEWINTTDLTPGIYTMQDVQKNHQTKVEQCII